MATRIYRTSTAGSQTTWTFSGWFKRGKIASGSHMTISGLVDANNWTQCYFTSSDKFKIANYSSSSTDGSFETSRRFRDGSAWYHLVVIWDTTNGTAADRVRLYINGERITEGTQSNPSASAASVINTNSSVTSLGGHSLASEDFYGCMSHCHFIDGTAYEPSVFGETDSTSGIWKIKTSPSVTYGTKGWFLKMQDRTNLDLDSGTNAFTMTTSGTGTATYDSPSNNFAVLNPVQIGAGFSGLSNGNTTLSLSEYCFNARSSLAMPGGKWYWEGKQSDKDVRFGVTTSNSNVNLDTDSSNFIWGDSGNGGIHLALSSASTSWQLTNNDITQSITTYTSGVGSGVDDIIMVALNVDTGKMWIGLNGTWFDSGDPAAGTNEIMTMTNGSPDPLCVFAGFGTSSARVLDMNFGNGYFGTTAVTSAVADGAGIGAFEYTPPTGFYALCTKNLKAYGG